MTFELIAIRARKEFFFTARSVITRNKEMIKVAGNIMLARSLYDESVKFIRHFEKAISNNESLRAKYNSQISRLMGSLEQSYHKAIDIYHGGSR